MCAHGVAQAQEYDSAAAQQEADPLTFTAGLGIIHDSNVVRLPSGLDPAVNGASSRGDTMLRGEVGARFDRQFSRQRLTVDGLVDGYKFFRNNSFSNVGYNGGINLDYEIGRAVFGRVGLRVSSFEPMIQDIRTGSSDRNKINSQFLYWQGGLRLTTNWAAILGADFDRRRNTLDAYKGQDLDRTSVEGGARFMRANASFLDFVWRHTKGSYDTDLTTDANGAPLAGGPVSRNYKQDSLLLRSEYRPNEGSRVGGQIGWTRRRNETDLIPNFSGLTMSGDVDWALTGATTVRFSVNRGVEPVEYATVGGYTESTGFAIRPSIRVTGLITLNPYYSLQHLKYRSTDATVNGRKDNLQTLGLGVDYAFRRTLSFWGDIRQERRGSSNDAYRFTANIIGAGVRARF